MSKVDKILRYYYNFEKEKISNETFRIKLFNIGHNKLLRETYNHLK